MADSPGVFHTKECKSVEMIFFFVFHLSLYVVGPCFSFYESISNIKKINK